MDKAMNEIKENFRHYKSEYLLGKRALGEELSEEAHKAIEEILAERGEKCPPIPKQPIYDAGAKVAQEPRRSAAAKNIVFVVLALMVLLFGQAFIKGITGTVFGVIASVVIVSGWGWTGWRNSKLSAAEKEDRRRLEMADAQGLSELMLVAAEGDVARVVELLDYGAVIDASSINGSTALMYAARNNKEDVVRVLLERGANWRCRNRRGDTALTIAQKFSCTGVLELLSQAASGDAR